jgi:hypothetical protein
MFTSKFVGLKPEDGPTPYYYGSLPVEPTVDQTLFFEETGNLYQISHIDGKPWVGSDVENQREMAWADIGSGKTVPTLLLHWLRKLEAAERLTVRATKARGRSFTYEEMKEYSQRNRALRLSAKL